MLGELGRSQRFGEPIRKSPEQWRFVKKLKWLYYVGGPGTYVQLGAHSMELTPVRPEDPERDARRYELLKAYLLRTGLMRRVRVQSLPTDSDAQRYRMLRDHVLSTGIIRHMKLPLGESKPFVIGKELYGETVEDAVDTLEGWDI